MKCCATNICTQLHGQVGVLQNFPGKCLHHQQLQWTPLHGWIELHPSPAIVLFLELTAYIICDSKFANNCKIFVYSKGCFAPCNVAFLLLTLFFHHSLHIPSFSVIKAGISCIFWYFRNTSLFLLFFFFLIKDEGAPLENSKAYVDQWTI